MHKKPILAETNRKQNISNKIPGAFNSRPKSSHAIQYAEKAIQHDSSPIKSQSKEKKLATPKTKFTTRDRSAEFCSFTSSRLKSFPAEEIKRIQCSPRAERIPPGFQQPEHPQQQLLSHEIIHGKGDGLFNHFPPPNAIPLNNQHHLSHPECHQTRPEIIIPSSYLRSAETQAHRPFVPIPRTAHVKEPQVTTSLIINPGPSDVADNFKTEKKETVSECPQVQENEKKIDNITKEVECEKQPVGGRNALLHRLKHMTEKKKTESLQVRRNSSFPQDQIPPQIKHPEENASKRCHFPQQNYIEDIHPNVYNIQRPVDHNINESMVYLQNQMMNPMLNQRNIIHQHPEHLNFYNKPNHSINLQNSMYNKNIKSSQRIHHNSEQIQGDGYPPRKPTTQVKKPKEKIYQFTPAMIHDQELLVTKMRQQGVKEDIMKRQFDALLNEQKRQLMFLQQLEEPQELIEGDRLSVRRRIIKFEEDGKPEWMAHITPPRVPCATFEKMNQSNMKTSKQKNNKSVRFNDQQKQLEIRNEELYPFSCKNGLQNNNYNFYPNVHQPVEQNMMTRTANSQQYCSCHHCIANYQNYFIQQHPEVPHGNNGYYSMQHTVQPQQNFPVWPNNYVINNDSKQYYANNCVNVNTNIPHDNLPQNYNDGGPEKNIEKDLKRNNGLQDEESIKKAMEELKNRESHKGYEYLANLNKNDKRLVLNGIQDPENELMKNFPYRQQPTENVEEVKKELRANGLENRRNPNNPLPPPNLHMKNFNEPFREYPRRKDELSAENYYYALPKNMIDGNLLSTIDGNEYQQILPAQKNIYDDSRSNSFMAQVYQVQGQTAGPYDYQNGYQLIRSNSMPCDINSHRHQCQGNPSHTQEIKILENHCKDGQKNLNSDLNDNEHQNSYNYIPQSNNNVIVNQNNLSNFPGVYQLIEPRIIGGIKYFARKFNYAPNLNNCSYPTDDRILNNLVVCNDKNCNK